MKIANTWDLISINLQTLQPKVSQFNLQKAAGAVIESIRTINSKQVTIVLKVMKNRIKVRSDL